MKFKQPGCYTQFKEIANQLKLNYIKYSRIRRQDRNDNIVINFKPLLKTHIILVFFYQKNIVYLFVNYILFVFSKIPLYYP